MDRTLVMGVLNVTPDSFSDGGRYADLDAAVAHGLSLAADGADIVDVGGESTRPGASRVAPEEESRRVVPVVAALVEAGVRVSVDTTRASVASAAVGAGATIVNDVSGGLADPSMLPVVAEAGVTYVAMHSLGPSDTPPAYGDVVADVTAALLARRDAAVAAGVERVVLDPGFGFSKTVDHNLALLAALPSLVALGPLLVGTSRKSFLGKVLDREVGERDAATQATTALAAYHGAWGVRVHAVRQAADAVRLVAAIGTAR